MPNGVVTTLCVDMFSYQHVLYPATPAGQGQMVERAPSVAWERTKQTAGMPTVRTAQHIQTLLQEASLSRLARATPDTRIQTEAKRLAMLPLGFQIFWNRTQPPSLPHSQKTSRVCLEEQHHSNL